MNYIHQLLSGLMLVSIASTASYAEQMPYQFIYYGNFKHMIHTGDDKGRIALSELEQPNNTWGLGATAGRKGEIIQIDGKIFVSPGTDTTGKILPHPADEQTTLFASAQVKKWSDITLPSDMDQKQLQNFILEHAEKIGISTHAPFVFRLNGQYPDIRWHVVTGEPLLAPKEKSNPHSDKKTYPVQKHVFHQSDAKGQIVGIYGSPKLEGIITHPNEYFHVHYIDDTATISGHVDAYSVKAGTILSLPIE